MVYVKQRRLPASSNYPSPITKGGGIKCCSVGHPAGLHPNYEVGLKTTVGKKSMKNEHAKKTSMGVSTIIPRKQMSHRRCEVKQIVLKNRGNVNRCSPQHLEELEQLHYVVPAPDLIFILPVELNRQPYVDRWCVFISAAFIIRRKHSPSIFFHVHSE